MTALKSARVLVLEDDAVQALALDATLSDFGAAEVRTISGVKAALRQIERNPPSIAILDVLMRDGERAYDVADALDRLHIPFIFFSAWDAAYLPSRYRQHLFVRKPAGSDEIVTALCRAMVRRDAPVPDPVDSLQAERVRRRRGTGDT